LGACIDVGGRVLDLADQSPQAGQHLTESYSQSVGFRGNLHVAGEVSTSDRLGGDGQLRLVTQGVFKSLSSIISRFGL
jgi:hypothetical protein